LCKPEWAKFLAELSCNSPVCTFIPLACHEAMSDWISGLPVHQDQGKLSILLRFSPVLADLIIALKGQSPPKPCAEMLLELLLIAKSPFSGEFAQEYPPSPEKFNDFFPSLPKIRERGNFAADSQPVGEECRIPGNSCKKYYRGHPTLSCGILTMFCKHEVCWGFSLLLRHESPASPFEVLETRFPIGPELVVYDNACHLNNYALNRDPKRYSATRFRIDRMHTKNHTTCSNGYALREFDEINSQMVEQNNSRLATLRAQLSYMNVRNFLVHCAIFLASTNEDKKKKWK